VSLIHIAVARSRFPAWLALLAILLLFIAPVISKSLMARHGHSPAMMMPIATEPSACATGDPLLTAASAGHKHAAGEQRRVIAAASTHATGKHHHFAAEPSANSAGNHHHVVADSSAHQHAAVEHPQPAATNADTKSADAARSPPFPHSSHLKHHPMSLMDDSACGYCVLLIHLSLDSVQLPRLWTLLQAATPAVPFELPALIVCWIPIWFRPRGPPVNALYPT